MMEGRFGQICWVVQDLEQSIGKWLGLGAGPFFLLDSKVLPDREYRGSVGRDHFRSAHGFFNDTQVELIQPTSDEPSIFREILDVRGESIHHVQPDCGIIDTAAFERQAARYAGQGLELVHKMILPGMGRIVYFDGREQFGHYLELVERPAHVYQNSINMYQAHKNWDGSDPIRQNKFIEASRAGSSI